MTSPTDGPEADSALQQLLDNELPIPERHRFQPLRMGLIGIWEYEEQVFYFYGGRLILRGHNGSGKTKALEVTSPLLLDGILHARRLDPFGNAARPMRDNLLYGGHTQRISYVWTEYGRVTESGAHEYLTIGIGMQALETKKTGLRDKWFFTTPQRVGVDFTVYGADRRPHNQAELTTLLGEAHVHQSAKDYRKALAKQLFGFSASRLASLIELLLTLRRPKLSEDLTTAKLSKLLKDGLPPVSGLLLEDLAGKFDELAREREDLQAHIQDKQHVDAFLSAYGRLARRVVHHQAHHLVTIGTERAAAAHHQRTKEDDLTGLRKRGAQHERQGQQLGLRLKTLEAKIIELNGRPEMEQHGLIGALQDHKAQTELHLEQATSRHTRAADDHATATAEHESEQNALKTAARLLDAAEQDTDAHAADTPLDPVHQTHRGDMRTRPQHTRRTLMGHVQARQHLLAQATDLAADVTQTHGRAEAAQAVCTRLLTRLGEAKAAYDTREEALQQQIRQLRAFLVEWSERCQQLLLSEKQFADLVGAVPTFGDDSTPALSELVAAHAQHVDTALADLLGRQNALRSDLQRRRDEVSDERDHVAAQEDAPPPDPITPRRPRTPDLDDGAPLYRLLEFAPGLSHQQQADLEAALLASGILDAWLTGDGRALAADTLETLLPIPDPGRRPHRSLADVLCPVDHPTVPAPVTQHILASIALDTPENAHPTNIGTDGTWHIGAVRGRTRGTTAVYIGATARATERQRRLTALDHELAQLDTQLDSADADIADTRRRRDDLEAERTDTLHKDRGVREARHARDRERSALEQLDLDMRQANEEQQARHHEWQRARRTLDDFARPRGIEPDAEGIQREQQTLNHYTASLTELAYTAQEHLQRTTAVSRATKRLATAEGQLRERADEKTQAHTNRDNAQERLDVRQRLVGADVDKVLAELKDATHQRDTTTAELDRNHAQGKDISKKIGALEQAVDGARREHGKIDSRFRETVEDYRRLAEHGYLALAGANSVTGQDVDAVHAQARATLDQLADEPGSEAARNEARNEADKEFRLLQTGLAGPDWRPRAQYDGALFLVTLLHNGQSHTVPQAQDIMANEIHSRQGFLGDEERELFTEVLLGRLGDHLRRRRAEAASLVDRMNTLLQQVPTSSGHLLKLIWEPDPKQDQGVLDALKALDGQSTEHLADGAREQLIRFLVDRVEAARQNESSADWRTHLKEALDYRAWSRIRIRHKAGPGQKWTDQSDHKHHRGSGGEQAVALQLPLFVAAAAHYAGAAPTAPRPIYLDEAFAGIDAPMRGRCMALLTQLDLDFVLASHDEWGFHKEVPKVATYQLFRHQGLPGVLTTPILWDGAKRHPLPDPALRQDAAEAGIDWEDDEDLLDEEYADPVDESADEEDIDDEET
ncbi:TIGR02680 family protein [Streptomyces endophyticus]|uniref:TIGR02680 family protein n=1 Tax=Streptomyces endophyticus TaxID=714166 RepID=A0ABU6FIW6_9ACTN|nr:TIGR02680 family protein [Streptomyces endophyticus]MEB8343408.1 TIGR02680 family protein [Streptomyces endophyticus]